MYIDKLYTKLYSERNWNGLSQLVNEIKRFSRASDKKFKDYVKSIEYPDLRRLAKKEYDNMVSSRAKLLNHTRPADYITRRLNDGLPLDDALKEYKRQKKAFYKDVSDLDGNIRDQHEIILNKVKEKTDALEKMRNWKDVKLPDYNKSKLELTPNDYDEWE